MLLLFWIICFSGSFVIGEIRRSGTTLKIQPFYFPPNLSAGQSAKILCTVIQGSYPVNFEWSKDGQEITSTNNIEITTLKDISILIINSIGIKDSGNYTCTASNNFGSINHTSLLAVDAPPRWISEPQDVDVRVGKPVQIECSASGFPLPNISWKRFTEDGQSVEPLALQSENVSLILSSAGLKDAGSYICRAENGIGGLQKIIRLTILDNIPNIQPFNFPPNLSVGQSTKFFCTLVEGAHPVNFRWYKNGQEITGNKNIEITKLRDISILIFNNINIDDAGNYTCTVSNKFGSVNHTSLLAVEAPPTWISEPQDIDTTVGNPLKIECSATGFPMPKISWKRLNENGQEIEELISKTQNVTLEFASPTRNDNGRYICKANNGIGEIKKIIKLTILDNIPKIQPFNFPPNLSVGQKTKFLCTLIEGADPVNFRWFKDRQEITSNKNIEITYHKDMSILVINSINFEDAGNYTCTANNNFGSANHTSLLAVEAPPRWLFEPQDIDVKVGIAIQIECSAAGFPTPKITWKKISETGKSLGLHYGNSTFTISNVESEDSGNYVCKAENDIGHIQKVIRVTVLESPKIQPFNFKSVIQTGGKTTVACAIEKGDFPLEFSWVKDGKEIDKLENVKVSSHKEFSVIIIDPVLSESGGNYTCNVKNYHGSDSYTALLTIEDPPSWLIEPKDLEAPADSDVELQCSGKSSPKPRINWFKISDVNDKQELLSLDGILKLSKISTTDSGRYLCTISNGVGETLNKEIILKVLGDIKIQPFTLPHKTSEGETIKILCSVTKGEKPFQFQWLKNEVILKADKRIEINTDRDGSILKITDVNSNDSGNYTCLVNNRLDKSNYTAALIVEAPPRWIVEPSDIEVRFGEKIEINCIVSGFPTPRVIWKKINDDGRESLIGETGDILHKNGSLVLFPISDFHHGKYNCEASNGVGLPLRKTIKVTVLGDLLTIHPLIFPSKISEGDNINIMCSVARGEKPFQFEWLKDGIKLKNEINADISILKDTSILSINNINVKDSGNYTCIVRNNAGVANFTSFMIVEAPPRWIVEPDDIEIQSGRDLKLKCEVSGYPLPHVTWRKIERPEKVNYKSTRDMTSHNGTVILSSASESDAGEYECTASNGVGKSLNKKIKVVVLGVVPIIQPFTLPNILIENDSTKLLCAVLKGTKPLSFKWFKDGNEIITNTNVEVLVLQDSSILTIHHLNTENNGNYTCVVSNTMGVTNYTTKITVRAEPKWILEPKDVEISLGSSATLECSASGYPIPSVTWSKIIDDMTTSQEQVIIKNGSLHFHEVTREDNGFYVCQVDNGVGQSLKKTINLRILVPAKFEEKFAVVSSRRGDSTSLKCEATGDQPLSIVWKKDMVELGKSGGNRYEIFETLTPKGLKSELIIRETERTDSSMYSCEAENPYGKDDRNMKLLVLEVPARPLNVKVHDVWSRSVSVSWSPPYTGNSPITQYVVQYWRDQGAPHRLQEKDVTSSQTSTLIKELNPGTTYTLSVVAENAVGRGESSQTVTFTTGEEEPSGAPVDVSVEAKGSSSLFVSWKDPPRSDWNGQLKGYYVGYKVLDSAQPYSFKTLEYSQSTIHEHMITNLRKDTEYKIVVKAFNAAGSGPASQDVLVRTLGGDLPLPPIVFIASTTDSAIKVQWRPQDTRTPLTGHVIHYRKKSERWQQIPVLTPSENVFSINGLESGAMYQLYVTSANEFGEGDPSEVLNIKTSGHSNDNLILLAGGQDAPYYLDLSLLVPVAASVAAIIVVTIVVCIWVQKARGRRNLERALREEKHYNYGPASQRYVDIEKSRQYPYPDSDLSSNYPTPYATVPMRDDVSESGNDPHQEMKSFLPQSMKDRPLPVPKTSSLKKKEESHIYDSPQ